MHWVVAGTLLFTGFFSSSAFITGWFTGSQGYETAVDQQRKRGGPMLVYFRTDWCGYCKKLDKGLLYKAETKSQLQAIPKVMINPEKSRANQKLANRFGVRGYPSMYVIRSNGEFSKVTGYKQHNGQWALMSPGEFRSHLEKVGGQFPAALGSAESFGTKKQNNDSTATAKKTQSSAAHVALQKAGKHEQAVAVLNTELKKSPADPTLYFARGVSQAELRRYAPARRDLETAIALDDSYTEARYALTKIYLKLEMWSDARNALDDLIESEPSGKAYYMRGVTFEKSGRRELALDDFASACNLGEKRGCSKL